jgi:sec-independent protein translocase protein TatA
MPFNVGPLELVIVLVIALLILGPGRLPEVGSALGKSIREFRKAATDVQDATKIDTTPKKAEPAAPAAAPQPPAQVTAGTEPTAAVPASEAVPEAVPAAEPKPNELSESPQPNELSQPRT